MASPDSPADPASAREPGDLVDAGIYATPSEGFAHGLVVLAMGEPYCLLPSAAGFRLLVEPAVLDEVREQLACYDRESADWPPRPVVEAGPGHGLDLFTPLLWGLLVMAVFWAQRRWPGRLEAVGVLDSRAVFDRGEWWRPITALFLHAGVGHLTSNLLSGVPVFAAVVTTLGRARGWLLLGLAAVAGNFAIAAVNYPGPYESLGASTAIFAGFGLLTGRAVRVLRRPGRVHPWRAVLVPLAAGVALLGLLGTGGVHTDVGAHVAGFSVGLILGFAAAREFP